MRYQFHVAVKQIVASYDIRIETFKIFSILMREKNVGRKKLIPPFFFMLFRVNACGDHALVFKCWQHSQPPCRGAAAPP